MTQHNIACHVPLPASPSLLRVVTTYSYGGSKVTTRNNTSALRFLYTRYCNYVSEATCACLRPYQEQAVSLV